MALACPALLAAIATLFAVANAGRDGHAAFIEVEDLSHLNDNSQDEESAENHAQPVFDLNTLLFPGNVLRSDGNAPAKRFIVLFCYSWYQACGNFFPKYEGKALEWDGKLNRNELFTKQVRFAYVDCATDKELCNEQGIDSYPSVVLYEGGTKTSVFTHSRGDAAARFDKWLTKQLGNLLDDITPDPAIFARKEGVSAAEMVKYFMSYVKVLEVLARRLRPGDRALDISLALLGFLLTCRMALSNLDILKKDTSKLDMSTAAKTSTTGGAAAATGPASAQKAAADADAGLQQGVERCLPKAWAQSRGSMVL